ncbi:WD repeat-containing 26-like [Chlorella sorokiniana]|uniref:WD repeat-containing 26-like n=1 Tax=Chlorella sorokiniana TaxID=3076 RepID=A0A2P6TTT0_CHLSO|nr:WD repeat-containing 26-like [Chlorella sorokiniana]|eukprot:PRW57454.1 WD repeat-containing 26-like [Chlorella sorokiniana]
MAPLNNGSLPPSAVGHRGFIDRVEYVRLLEQALRALGYEGVARQLEGESGVTQQPAEASAFRAAVLQGDYDAALQLLPAVAADPSAVGSSRVLLLKAKYVELVQRGATGEALQVLRQELQPLAVQQQVLHSLAALLLRSPHASAPPSPAASGAAASPGGGNGSNCWGGAVAAPSPSLGPLAAAPAVSEEQLAEGRAALLEQLQGSLHDSLLIPERRLEELVEQALLSQLDRCPFSNSLSQRLSLFSDYQAGPDQLPSLPGQVLRDHSSEVWAVAFSPDGQWAASASKDGSALLWAVTASGRLEGASPLQRQATACQLVAFSPSSQMLLVASLDATVRLYDVGSARLLRIFTVGGQRTSQSAAAGAVTAISWFPDGARFLAATHKAIEVFDSRHGGGGLLHRLRSPHAFTYDVAVAGSDCLITVGQDRKIGFTRLSDGRTHLISEWGTVTSIALSRCGRLLATNLTDSQVHLWQLPPGLAAADDAHAAAAPHSADYSNGMAAMNGSSSAAGSVSAASPPSPPPLHLPPQLGQGGDPFDQLPMTPFLHFRMGEARPSRFVLRSCIGGGRSGFVACGAEDGPLYIWSARTGQQLQCLEGHSGCVNAVAWNPALPWLLASAGDDGTVRTFLAPAVVRR